MLTHAELPGVLFTMRYPDDTGYVWNYIASVRDRAAEQLRGTAIPYLAFPRLTGNPSYQLRHLIPVELDCYDNSRHGRDAVEAFVRKHNIKVVVFMSALPAGVCLSLFRRLGVATLNTEDDSYDTDRRDGLAKRSIKYLIRRVLRRQSHDLHLANSKAQQRFLLEYSLLPPDRVALMENSIDCEHFCPGDQAAARAQTGLDPDRFWILSVAQARTEKRIEALIQVMHEVVQARPAARIGFVYVGDGDLVAEWKQQAAALGLADCVVFAGRQNDVVPYYRSADLLVHAAKFESFGLAIVEAMACGLPVVASAAAGPRETIAHGTTGELVGIDDFDAFTRAVLRYVDDPAMTKLQGRNARAHVNAAYNIVRHGKDFAAHIRRFL
jgi:glycosyltransferase involved in cell wall biosynthesis